MELILDPNIQDPDGFYEALMPVINICTQHPDDAGDVQGGRRRRRGRPIEDTRPMLKAAIKRKVGIIGMKVANPGFLGANTQALLDKAFPRSDLSLHQKAYTWMLQQEGISSVIVGIRNAMHLKQAIEVGKAI